MIRAGRTSSSRSKSSSSTPVARRENRLKFAPSPRIVAPSGALPVMRSVLAEQLFRCRNHSIRLEAEFVLQLFQRRRSAKCLHADDTTGQADVPFPAECRCLLDGNPRRHLRGQHAIAILLTLTLEDVP